MEHQCTRLYCDSTRDKRAARCRGLCKPLNEHVRKHNKLCLCILWICWKFLHPFCCACVLNCCHAEMSKQTFTWWSIVLQSASVEPSVVQFPLDCLPAEARFSCRTSHPPPTQLLPQISLSAFDYIFWGFPHCGTSHIFFRIVRTSATGT